MNHVGTRGFDRLDLFGEARKVGGQDGWGDPNGGSVGRSNYGTLSELGHGEKLPRIRVAVVSVDPDGVVSGSSETLSARDIALEVLRRVSTQRAFASSALRSVLEDSAKRSAAPTSAADRALATELVYGVLRRRGLLDRAVRRASGKRLKDIDPKIHDVLRLGAYQLMYLDRVPAHAAVNAAVEQAKKRRGPRGAGLVNAVLRKLADSPVEDRLPAPPPLATDPVGHVAAVGGLPEKIARLFVQDLGPQEAAAFAVASLGPAPLTLRVNRLRATEQAVAAEVDGQAGTVAGSIRLPSGRVLPADLAAVREGRATPQDEASMRVVMLLDPQPGDRVLDVCAAPGGKTTHVAELMNDVGTVVAHDRLPARLRRVIESADRLGLSSVKTADVLPPDDEMFDRVLVDAPCSGLGTLRRHPEIRWRLTDDDLAVLTKTQSEVLDEGARRVRVGGTLVYSVCTVTRAEGEGHLAELGDGFDVQEILRTGPHQSGEPDGFFAAKLIRTSSSNGVA